MPFDSTRTCRPCSGTGVGAGWGETCAHCAGSGNAAPDAPPRLRRGRVPEAEPERPTEAQLDQLSNLIDAVDHRHPEHEYACSIIGRTDLTEAQCAGAIAALTDLVPPPPQRTHRTMPDSLYLASPRRPKRRALAPARRPQPKRPASMPVRRTTTKGITSVRLRRF